MSGPPNPNTDTATTIIKYVSEKQRKNPDSAIIKAARKRARRGPIRSKKMPHGSADRI
jgi:hypothetical protein